MLEKTVFIYALVDPRKPDYIRYIGKTKNMKFRLRDHISDSKKAYETGNRSYKINWIHGLLKQNIRPEIQEIAIVPEKEWQFWEKHYISLFRSWGFRLTNETEGGDGVVNAYEVAARRKAAGKYAHTEETKKVIREKRALQVFTEETRRKLSLTMRGRKNKKKGTIRIYNPETGKITNIEKSQLNEYIQNGWLLGEGKKGKILWINNGIEEKVGKISELKEFLDNGWKKGRLSTDFKNRIWINNGVKNKRVKEEEIDSHLKNGWMLGRSEESVSNVKKGQREYWDNISDEEYQKQCDIRKGKGHPSTPETNKKISLANRADITGEQVKLVKYLYFSVIREDGRKHSFDSVAKETGLTRDLVISIVTKNTYDDLLDPTNSSEGDNNV